MDIILVILDSLRQDHVGAYGNDWIHTPHLDTFTKESVISSDISSLTVIAHTTRS